MTRRTRRHERRREHERFTRARDKEGRARIDHSAARAERKRQRGAARKLVVPAAVSATLPPRRFLDLGPNARNAPMARAFLAPQSASGPRHRQRHPLKGYYTGGLPLPRPVSHRGQGSLKYAIREGLRRPHGRPRGTL